MTDREEFLALHGHRREQAISAAYCELCNPAIANRLSHEPAVEADARRYGRVFLSVDASIALHHRLEIAEPWNRWEYPRRLAALRILKEGEPEQGRLL